MTNEELMLVNSAARRLLQAAALDQGVEPVIDTAYEILGIPISVADTLFHSIAFRAPEGVREEDCARNDKNDTPSRRRWMQTVKGSQEPVIDEEGKLYYRAMCFDVRAHGMELAKLSIFETRPFRPTDSEILKILADALACVLTSGSSSPSLLPDQLFSDLLRNLIMGHLTHDELQRMEKVLDLAPETERQILVLQDREGCTVEYPAIQMRCFQQFGITTTLYESRIICLQETSRCRNLEHLQTFLQEYQLQCGVSRVFLQLSEVRDHYLQAVFALQCAQKEGALLLPYASCLIKDVAAHCRIDRGPSSFCRPEILTLYHYDQRYGTSYIATLRCYCENLCNMANTARSSFLHYNTIKYRLRMIREICGIDQISAKDLFEFLLSFELLELPASPTLLPEE